ncbi:hypothetical protein [Tissierella sp.]|uniref:hypothetical protein n=1 Tax=Tissierella sp. TaxID=41274 RepID=UPI0028AE6E4F|nr:hypothetical protein [Tissierella sp.]
MVDYNDSILKQNCEYLMKLIEKGNNDNRLIEEEWRELQTRAIKKQKKEYFARIKEESERHRTETLDRFRKEAEESSNELKKQLLERMERFYNLMYNLGWAPHLEMNVAEARKIVEASATCGEDELEVMINDYYTKKYNIEAIDYFLNNWEKSKTLKKRIPILKQAINAHKKGDYFLSTCIFISQLEGVIADSENHIGNMGGTKIRGYLEKRVTETETYSFGYAYKNFFNERLYCSFEHGKSMQSPIGRHAILHGADTEYGTEVNSLKVILIFDNLFYYFA